MLASGELGDHPLIRPTLTLSGIWAAMVRVGGKGGGHGAALSRCRGDASTRARAGCVPSPTAVRYGCFPRPGGASLDSLCMAPGGHEEAPYLEALRAYAARNPGRF